MSTTTTRVPLEEARAIAATLVALLRPACTSLTLAGSIRRRKPDVGDIDLVVEPLLIPTLDLFGEPDGPTIDTLTELCDQMVEAGMLAKRYDKNGRASWGASLKRAVFRGLNVDIQVVADPDTLGAWTLIRTGPAEFNKALVTPRHQGGLLPPGFEFRDGFRLYRAGGRIPTPTEESVFAALGLPYLAPTERTVAAMRVVGVPS